MLGVDGSPAAVAVLVIRNSGRGAVASVVEGGLVVAISNNALLEGIRVAQLGLGSIAPTVVVDGVEVVAGERDR